MTPHRVRAGDVTSSHVGMVVAHAVRNAAGTKFVLKKGNILGDEHVGPLRELGDRELHLLEAGLDDVHEVEAGARLARAVAGPGIELRAFDPAQLPDMAFAHDDRIVQDWLALRDRQQSEAGVA